MKLCDENTIGVVAILGSTFDGSYEPVAEICEALDAFQAETGIDVPVHVDGASGAFVAPFVDPELVWDFQAAARRLDQRVRPQVRPRVPGRRLDRLARRRGAPRRPDLLGQLPRRQHADVRAQLLAPRRAGRRAVLQLPAPRLRGLPRGAGLRPRGRDAALGAHRRDRAVRADHARRRAPRVRVQAEGRRSRTTRSSTSRTPFASGAGRFPPTPSRRTARTSPRCGSSCGAGSPTTSPTCSSSDIRRQLPRLESQPAPVHDASTAAAFHH